MCLAAAGRIALYYIEFEGLTFCILGAAQDQNSANFFGEPDGDWFAAYLCNQDGKGGLIMSGFRNQRSQPTQGCAHRLFEAPDALPFSTSS